MRTTQTKAARNVEQLAEDVAAANALRASWRPGSRRATRTKQKATACSCDGDDHAVCGCEVEPEGAPSALINSAWLDELSATLRTRARELDEWVATWQGADAPENVEAYAILAHALRVEAVRAQGQAEAEVDVMREAVSRVRMAADFARVG